MSNRKIKQFIMGSLGCYFGWMLAFPFYGPIYTAVSTHKDIGKMPLVLYFITAHTITHIAGGLWLRRVSLWHQIMKISLIITVLANILLIFDNQLIWIVCMIIMGIASAMYILGWSVLYSLSGQIHERVKIMAITIIISNLILLSIYLLKPVMTVSSYFTLSLIPLLAAGYFQKKLSPSSDFDYIKSYVKRSFPKHWLISLFLFVFSIYLNGGFLYTIMLPALRAEGFFASYYPYVVYICILVVIYRFNQRINKALIVYLGISLLGLAFISFALLSEFASGYLMTIGLMESSFALLDLFLWTTLGYLAFEYGAPYQIFGLTLGANTASIVAGDFIGKNLSNIYNNTHLTTALLSAASILLAIIVIPWLMRSINQSAINESQVKSAQSLYQKNTSYNHLLSYLPRDIDLTDRETDIVHLILQGMTNKDIARELFISDHTVKTHIRNICGKFGIARKKELLYLASRKIKDKHN